MKRVRYIIQNKINTVEEVKDFDLDGYTYNEVLSKENELVFTRDNKIFSID